MITAAATDSRRLLAERLAPVGLEDEENGYWSLEFRALGSACVLLFAADNKTQAADYHRRAFEWLIDFEARFSRFLPDSVTSRINDNAGLMWTDVDEECEIMLSICDYTHFKTQHAFDATSLPLSLLWDWKRKHDSLPSLQEIKHAQTLIGWNRVEREKGRIFLPDKGMMIDFGGVGKEFAVDVLAQIGQSCGLKNLRVNLGGDITVLGTAPGGCPWLIGLENPEKIGECHCGIRLRSGVGVATSGDYRRFFMFDGRRYGHIIDCRTGWPVANETVSVSVIAQNCVTAGILSTSAMVMGRDEALQMLDNTARVEGCLWSKKQLHKTRGFFPTELPDDWNSD